MNLSQCSLRQPLVFHCSWSPEGCKDWMPLSALGQAPHHLKRQLEKAKKSCEYFVVWSTDKVKDIPHHIGVVGGLGEFEQRSPNGGCAVQVSLYCKWLNLSATIIDSPLPHKSQLRYFALPAQKKKVFWPFTCILHQFETLNLEQRETTKIQSYGYILLSERKLPSLWVRVKRFLALKFQLPVLIV